MWSAKKLTVYRLFVGETEEEIYSNICVAVPGGEEDQQSFTA